MKHEQSKSWIFWAVVCIMFLIGVRFLLGRKPGLPETISSYVIYPFLAIHHQIIEPYTKWKAHKRAIGSLEHCIEQIANDRDQLQSYVIAMKAELDYLEAIKELLVFKERYHIQDAIITQVISKHFSSDGHYFLVDAGQRQGVTHDMIAVYNNCLLGRVVEVYPQYSKVVAITDKSCDIAVYCSETKTAGIHEGSNDSCSSSLKFVSHLKEIKEGDYLLSSGEGMVFPRGFGVGRICSYESDNLLYRIKVKPLVDLRDVEYCSLLHRGLDEKIETAVADSWQGLIKEAQVDSAMSLTANNQAQNDSNRDVS